MGNGLANTSFTKPILLVRGYDAGLLAEVSGKVPGPEASRSFDWGDVVYVGLGGVSSMPSKTLDATTTSQHIGFTSTRACSGTGRRASALHTVCEGCVFSMLTSLQMGAYHELLFPISHSLPPPSHSLLLSLHSPLSFLPFAFLLSLPSPFSPPHPPPYRLGTLACELIRPSLLCPTVHAVVAARGRSMSTRRRPLDVGQHRAPPRRRRCLCTRRTTADGRWRVGRIDRGRGAKGRHDPRIESEGGTK